MNYARTAHNASTGKSTAQVQEHNAMVIASKEREIKTAIAEITRLGGTIHAGNKRLKIETIKSAPPKAEIK